MTNGDKLAVATHIMQKQALFDFGHERRQKEWLDNMKGPVNTGAFTGSALGFGAGIPLAALALGEKGNRFKSGWKRLVDSANYQLDGMLHPIQTSRNVWDKLIAGNSGAGRWNSLKGYGSKLKPAIVASLITNALSTVGSAGGAAVGINHGLNTYGPPPKRKFIGF